MRRARLQAAKTVVGLCGVVALLASGCASEQEKKGRELYTHYCSDCHGESGRQNEGFNWSAMPDPKPKDLSNKSEMSTFKDEELFATISRNMLDTSEEGGDEIGDDDFAVPTMPTFKYTLSEEEIWAIVGHVRTLHGMKMEFDVAARKRSLEEGLKAAQEAFDRTKQAYEEAERKANEEAERKSQELNKDIDVDESAYADELAAMTEAKKELEAAKAALNNFTTRPGKGQSVPRPDLTTPPAEMAQLVERGKRLYENKYGCNGCHSLAGEGGKIGPPLDRAGFRLNPTWIYRWLKNPQAMDSATRMPALGLSDADAKAVTFYLGTLQAPKAVPQEEKPVETP
ncbi:MAG: c-type cytochrome [Nitrospira sp.]|nr:c-type cytochrome [Nitrospira sp.]MCP9461110.1 c-type cytochrome [Nitrospira sp.]MCP9473775.1 c-type cytochrome [Nitrospira sp.]